MTETRDKLIIESETQGVQKSTNEVQGLSKAMDGVTVAAEKTERSTTSLEGKFSALERRLGTTAAQSRQFEKDQKTINEAVAQNPALAARAADAQAALAARYVNSAKASAELVKSTGLARHELINLSRQAQDVGVSLASGQSPFTVLVQQGSQIADVFASSTGTVRGFFSQAIGWAGRFATSAAGIASGAAAIGAGAILIGNNWSEAQRQIDQALIGIGRRSGETRQSINNFAKDNASATGLSIAEARNVAIEFAKTGNLAASGLKGVSEAVRGYSILTGKDASEATKDLAKTLSGDLVAAALKVDSVYGVMNASTLESVRSLEAQGKRAEAVQVILDRMAPTNQKAAESVGLLSRAWTGLTNVLSNITNGPSSSPSSDDIQGQINSLRQQRERAASSRAVGVTPGGMLNTAAVYGGKSAELAELDKQIDALQAKLNSLTTERATAQLDKLSTEAFKIGQAVLPQIDAISKLDDAIRKMKEAQAGGVAPANASGIIAVLEHQRSLQQDSLDTTVRQAQVVTQLQAAWGGVSAQTAVTLTNLQGQLGVAGAVTGEQRIQAQTQATYNDLLAQGVSSQEAMAIAVKQEEVARAAATAQVYQQVNALNDQTAMIDAVRTGTEASTAAAIAYKNAIQAGADATAAAAASAATLANYMAKAKLADQQQLDAFNRSEEQKFNSQDHSGFTASFDVKGSRPGTFVADPRYGASPDATFISNPGLIFDLPTLMEEENDRRKKEQRDLLQRRFGSSVDLNAGSIDDLNAAQNVYAQSLSSGTLEERRAGLALQISSLSSQPFNFERQAQIAALVKSMNELKDSVDGNTAAQEASLNPLYGGRGALHVGYYNNADGGILGPSGRMPLMPLHQYANGGIAYKPQIALFGEAGPEAFVPLKDGAIPVKLAGNVGASNDNSKTTNVTNNIVIGGETKTSNRRSARQLGTKYAQLMASIS